MNSRHIKSFKWKYFWKGTNGGPFFTRTIRRVLDHIKAEPKQRQVRSVRNEIEIRVYDEK